jgi:hypothetical protein
MAKITRTVDRLLSSIFLIGSRSTVFFPGAPRIGFMYCFTATYCAGRTLENLAMLPIQHTTMPLYHEKAYGNMPTSIS